MHLSDDDAGRGFEQCEVRERLWEVAQVVAGLRVEFLRVKSERRCDAQQPFHQVACPLQLADDGEGGD